MTALKHYPLYFLTFLLLPFTIFAQAQTSALQGKITEAETGVPITGATILVVQANAESPVAAGQAVAVSDADGFFAVAAKAEDTLRVTYVGKAPFIYVVKNSSDFIAIALAEVFYFGFTRVGVALGRVAALGRR